MGLCPVLVMEFDDRVVGAQGRWLSGGGKGLSFPTKPTSIRRCVRTIGVNGGRNHLLLVRAQEQYYYKYNWSR